MCQVPLTQTQKKKKVKVRKTAGFNVFNGLYTGVWKSPRHTIFFTTKLWPNYDRKKKKKKFCGPIDLLNNLWCVGMIQGAFVGFSFCNRVESVVHSIIVVHCVVHQVAAIRAVSFNSNCTIRAIYTLINTSIFVLRSTPTYFSSFIFIFSKG